MGRGPGAVGPCSGGLEPGRLFSRGVTQGEGGPRGKLRVFVAQVRNYSRLDEGCSSGCGEKWSDSGYFEGGADGVH